MDYQVWTANEGEQRRRDMDEVMARRAWEEKHAEELAEKARRERVWKAMLDEAPW